MSESRSTGRRPGRPRKSDGHAFPVDEVDRLLVHGQSGAEGGLRFPTYRELGKRYGVSHTVIAKYAQTHDCLGRRERAAELVRRKADEQLIASRAEKLSVQESDLLRMIDRFALTFEEALKEGRVRTDNPADFNTMCRLRSFLLGNADSRHELVRGLSLADLKQRYEEYERQKAEATDTPELGGYGKH